jgi:hypothetical protein
MEKTYDIDKNRKKEADLIDNFALNNRDSTHGNDHSRTNRLYSIHTWQIQTGHKPLPCRHGMYFSLLRMCKMLDRLDKIGNVETHKTLSARIGTDYSIAQRRSNMSQEKKPQRIDREKLPLFYRFILKIPIPAISTFIDIPSGIFYAIILPIFVFLDFFVNIYLLIGFSFPINIFLVCVVPVVILAIFERVTADRFINWWNSGVVGGYVQRDVKEVLKEYLALQENKAKEETTSG